jgi:hypothetical protein
MTRRLLPCGAVFLAAAALATGPVAAETLRAQYSIKLIGLPLGTASLTSNIEPATYNVDLNVKLTGLASMVSRSKAAGAASGIIGQGRVAPNSYATTSANGDTTRTVRIALTSGTVKAAEVVPPYQELPGRIPVLEAHKRNITDPLSALIMPIPEGAAIGPAACNRVLPVYDGWARFDVTLSYVGQREIKTKGYTGPVSVCAARYTPVSGHRPDRPGTKFMTDNREMEVWLAPVGTSRVVAPYRISVATMIGTAVIEATQFETIAGSKAAAR